MADNKHLLFIATACLGGAAVGFAMRTKAKVPIVEVQGDSTISDAPLGMLETADKPAVDHTYPEAPLNDQHPGISAPHVGHRDVKVEEDLRTSGVHLPMVETVDKAADVRRADVAHPSAGNTSNGFQQLSMESTCSYGDVHVPELDFEHTELAYHLEKCGAYVTDVPYISSRTYGTEVDPSPNQHLRVQIGGSEFYLGKVSWYDSCLFSCIMTSNQQKCEEHLRKKPEHSKCPSRWTEICRQPKIANTIKCGVKGGLCCYFY